jgi:thioredoxin reductase
MGSLDFNLVVIGGGPAGLSGALAATAFYVDMLRALSKAERQSPRLPREH